MLDAITSGAQIEPCNEQCCIGIMLVRRNGN